MKKLAFILATMLTACSFQTQFARVYDGHPRHAKGRGHAAVVGTNTVVTAYHVIDHSVDNPYSTTHVGKTYSKWGIVHRYYPMDVSHMVVTPKNREPVVFLKSRDNKKLWNKHLNIGRGLPYKVVTSRGTFPWYTYKSEKGDSGSPILNKNGELVGLVWGSRRRDGESVVGGAIMLRVVPGIEKP